MNNIDDIRAEIFADILTVAQVRRELAKEIDDPEVSLFHDLRSLPASKWDCEKIFVACCVLHNMMLDEMVQEQAPPRVGRGCCMPDE